MSVPVAGIQALAPVIQRSEMVESKRLWNGALGRAAVVISPQNQVLERGYAEGEWGRKRSPTLSS